MSAYVAKHLDGMQKDWNVATQKRLATVAAALGGIKSLKMMGMEDAVQSLISYLRSEEIGSSKRLRWILVTNNASGTVPSQPAPKCFLTSPPSKRTWYFCSSSYSDSLRPHIRKWWSSTG